VPSPIPAAYADCIHLTCQQCGAEPSDYCTNPVNGLHRGTPCWTRIHDAECDRAESETRR
jgi:hypothetical protein